MNRDLIKDKGKLTAKEYLEQISIFYQKHGMQIYVSSSSSVLYPYFPVHGVFE
jgi:hypothetical protein